MSLWTTILGNGESFNEVCNNFPEAYSEIIANNPLCDLQELLRATKENSLESDESDITADKVM